MDSQHFNHHKLSIAGVLITIGIIFGDIGTSPLYVMSAIIGEKAISEMLILGALSCIFWTLTLQTTVKYVIITLRADNKGEGGIFSLYTLVRRYKKWLIVPAMIGGAALLADGIITPPISVASAIEGLESSSKGIKIPTVPIVIGILVALFTIQQFGTKFVGKAFGPVMLTWFLMLAVFGSIALFQNPTVLKALNPVYAVQLLAKYPGGFWLLGGVFLCTTGAEALYSDLGHCGRPNIRISWIFVKTSLVLNYFGQGAKLLNPDFLAQNGNFIKIVERPLGEPERIIKELKPFFLLVPEWFLLPAVIIATAAAIVASQALISGSFTLINEAMRLNLWPKMKINYPSDIKGQLYIPTVNWSLLAGCIGVVLYFQKSAGMEAAYGLSIIVCMLSTTILLTYYMIRKKWNPVLIIFLSFVFLTVESAFLGSNLEKFPHGGYISLGIGALLVGQMYIMVKAKQISKRYIEMVKLKNYGKLIKQLSIDESIPKYSTHLVYMTGANHPDEVEEKVVHSILQKQPKRADIYWFIHVHTVDEPYKAQYEVTHFWDQDVIRIDFFLGFRVEPRVSQMFRQVVEDMVQNKEIDITSRYQSLNQNKVVGDFKFVVIQKYLSNDNQLPWFENLVLNAYFLVKKLSLSEPRAYGLDTSNVLVEKFPLVFSKMKPLQLKRIFRNQHEQKPE
jgi:KUP system potassium uptake protein